MTMTTKREGRTSRGEGYASPGAVSQHGGSLPVRICNACGGEVVWVESKRTGRPYLVSVSRGYLGQRFYMGHDLHPRDCGEIVAEARRADTAREAYMTLQRNVAASMRDLAAAWRAGEIDRSTLLEAFDVLADLSDEGGDR